MFVNIKEGYIMNYRRNHKIKEGLIPTALGTAVTAGAIAARCMDARHHSMGKRDIVPMLETAVLVFWLAHVVLGAIDLFQD
jgi:hypothetical protein